MAITKLGRDELVSMGARHRTDYLAPQARYTLGLLDQDPDVAALVGDGFRQEFQQALGQLEDLTKDRDLAGSDSKEAARAQGDALQTAKIWRRAFTRRVLAANLRGAGVPPEAGLIQAKGGNPAELSRDLLRLVSAGKEHQGALAEVGINAEFLDRGAVLAKNLSAVDQKQEVARFKKLPEKVREMYAQKALVYLAIKQVNHLGRSVHAEDHGRASRYNLDILYRRVRRQPVDPEPGVIGAPEKKPA